GSAVRRRRPLPTGAARSPRRRPYLRRRTRPRCRGRADRGQRQGSARRRSGGVRRICTRSVRPPWWNRPAFRPCRTGTPRPTTSYHSCADPLLDLHDPSARFRAQVMSAHGHPRSVTVVVLQYGKTRGDRSLHRFVQHRIDVVVTTVERGRGVFGGPDSSPSPDSSTPVTPTTTA